MGQPFCGALFAVGGFHFLLVRRVEYSVRAARFFDNPENSV
jgi:hypothetical protein